MSHLRLLLNWSASLGPMMEKHPFESPLYALDMVFGNIR
jgi:hypothetical protein